MELMHRHINIGSYSTSLQEWVQLNGLLDIHVGKRFEIVGGPTLNALFMNKTNGDYAINRPQIYPPMLLQPLWAILERLINGWVGVRV